MLLNNQLKINFCRYVYLIIDNNEFEQFLYSNYDEIEKIIERDDFLQIMTLDYKTDHSITMSMVNRNFIYQICKSSFPEYLFSIELCNIEIERLFPTLPNKNKVLSGTCYYFKHEESDDSFFNDICSYYEPLSRFFINEASRDQPKMSWLYWIKPKTNSISLNNDIIKELPDNINKLIDYAGTIYPPALAFAKEHCSNLTYDVSEPYEQIIITYCYNVIYVMNLFQKGLLPFFKAKEFKDYLGPYNEDRSERYIVGYVLKGQNNNRFNCDMVYWVSDDYYIYHDPISCFLISEDKKKILFQAQYYKNLIDVILSKLKV